MSLRLTSLEREMNPTYPQKLCASAESQPTSRESKTRRKGNPQFAAARWHPPRPFFNRRQIPFFWGESHNHAPRLGGQLTELAGGGWGKSGKLAKRKFSAKSSKYASGPSPRNPEEAASMREFCEPDFQEVHQLSADLGEHRCVLNPQGASPKSRGPFRQKRPV